MKKIILAIALCLATLNGTSMASENNTINLNALLDEIYEIKREQKSRKVDVSKVTKKYIKIGMPKDKIIQELQNYKKFRVSDIPKKNVSDKSKDWDESWMASANISWLPFFIS